MIALFAPSDPSGFDEAAESALQALAGPASIAVENVLLPAMIHESRAVFQRKRREHVEHARELLATFGLANRAKHRPSQLSGGQQQRAAIARALVNNPRIVFADEPTGNLDSRSGAEILNFMRHAVDDLGQTIVMVTHDPSAAGYADRVVFLADGHIVDEMLDPTAATVLDKMKSLGD